MKPIYVFAILGVLFVLFVESKNSTVAVTQANSDYANSTAGLITTTAGAIGSLAQDFSGYGLN